MITYFCRVCEKDFEHEISYGKDIECPHCHSLLSTDFDYCDVEGAMEPCGFVDGVVRKGRPGEREAAGLVQQDVPAGRHGDPCLVAVDLLGGREHQEGVGPGGSLRAQHGAGPNAEMEVADEEDEDA